MTSEYIRQSASVRSLFDQIAPGYDRGNALLSFGLHRRWNQRLIDALLPSVEGKTLLDLCAGTGAIGLRLLHQASVPSHAYLIDFSPQMLQIAHHQAQALPRHQIDCIEGDAHHLPLENGSIDGCTMAYGIRNLTDPLKCAHEVYRVLRPGGKWGILELTRPRSRVLQLGHGCYLKLVVPLLGYLAASDRQAYRYLAQTVASFTPPDQLSSQLCQAGFQQIELRSLMGGLTTLTVLQKPN